MRKNSAGTLKSISTKNLLKCAYKLNEIVKDKVSDQLPKSFGLIFGKI